MSIQNAYYLKTTSETKSVLFHYAQTTKIKRWCDNIGMVRIVDSFYNIMIIYNHQNFLSTEIWQKCITSKVQKNVVIAFSYQNELSYIYEIVTTCYNRSEVNMSISLIIFVGNFSHDINCTYFHQILHDFCFRIMIWTRKILNVWWVEYLYKKL